MKTIRFSRNQKRNNLMQGIAETMLDPDRIGFDEVKRYAKEFPKEPDFNIAQYGNLSVYYEQVRNEYKEAGYSGSYTDGELWDDYKRAVGTVARRIVEEGREAWQ